MATTANEIIDEFQELVRKLEDSAGAAIVAKVTVRAIENLHKQAEELSAHVDWIELTLPTDKQVEALKGLTLDETPEMSTMADKVRNACIAAEFDETINADLGRKLLAQYDAALDARKARKGTAVQSKMRGLGALITVTCGCGWVRNSPRGDWTSIRYQAKEHGKECDTANPGRGEQLTNDLDRVRHHLVDRREEVVSGGLTFTID